MSLYVTDEEEKIYRKALSLWGKEAQIDIAIEEMAELIKELSKFKRGTGTDSSILEEIADVHIMLGQLLLIFNHWRDNEPNFDEWYGRKLLRLENRVRKDE